MTTQNSKRQFTPLQKGEAYFFTLILLLLTVGLTIVFLLIFILDTVVPITNYYLAKKWEPTHCYILSSNIESRMSLIAWFGLEKNGYLSGNSFKRMNVTYQYQFANQSYVGNRYSFIPEVSSGNLFDGFHTFMTIKTETISSGLPDGYPVTCYVNPKNPQESVIDRSFNYNFLSTITPLIYPIFILFVVFLLYKLHQSPAYQQRRQKYLAGENPPVLSLSEAMDKFNNAMKEAKASEKNDPVLIRLNQLKIILMIIAILMILYFFIV